jgi:hypothetical protein
MDGIGLTAENVWPHIANFKEGTPDLERSLRPGVARSLHTGLCLNIFCHCYSWVFATTFLFGEMILLGICDD